MSAPDGPLLVLGIGNILARDDGIGVLVVRELEARVQAGTLELPPRTSLVDGGTIGLGLLPLVDEARALLIVDAVELGEAAGTVRVLQGAAIADGPASGVIHRTGLADLIASAHLVGSLPESTALIGVQPLDIAAGLDPSDPVRVALPQAVELAIAEIERLAGPPGPQRPGTAGAVSTPAKG